MASLRHPARAAALLLLSVMVAGCLTAERKIIRLNVKPDGSGTGSILYVNIMSSEEDGLDVSARDYGELVSKYLKGDEYDDAYLGLRNLKKRLYEDRGMLNGELTFAFDSYDDVGLYRYDNPNGQRTGPYMYSIATHGGYAAEKFEGSNGTEGPPHMPVLFWPDTTRNFEVVARIDTASAETRSLLPIYKRVEGK